MAREQLDPRVFRSARRAGSQLSLPEAAARMRHDLRPPASGLPGEISLDTLTVRTSSQRGFTRSSHAENDRVNVHLLTNRPSRVITACIFGRLGGQELSEARTGEAKGGVLAEARASPPDHAALASRHLPARCGVYGVLTGRLNAPLRAGHGT